MQCRAKKHKKTNDSIIGTRISFFKKEIQKPEQAQKQRKLVD